VERTKVMLIWPWSQQHQRTLELFPIGLGYLVSNIDSTFFDVKILDCALDNLHPTSDEFRQALRDFEPDVLGVSWWSVNTPIVEETLRVALEECPDVVLIAGGPHVTGRGEAIVGRGAVHYAFYGEAELGTAALLTAIREHGPKPPSSRLAAIPGLIYRDALGVKKTEQNFVEDLDEVVGIDYDRLRLRDYHKVGYYYGAKLQKKDELTAPIMSARGCPFRCTFCMAPTIDGRKIRRHSLERVVSTIRRLYEDFGARYIAIIDDNFTINTPWALEVCNAIADMKLEGLSMGTPNGIPLAGMNRELAMAMKRAGWREVMIAPETGSPRTLKAMQKPVDLERVPEFISLFHSVGLKVSAFFIIGYPEETLEDIALTKQFIFDNEFDFVGISIYQPLPGTAIYDRLVTEGTIPHGFIPGHYQEVTFKRRDMESGVLRDEYNRLWNEYRERRGMPIRNRAVASIREQMVVSALA
jgi:anaerobic magnesium-protoporphyrin IX monomethyl ester cyclase